MSINDSILSMLNIKDPNITISDPDNFYTVKVINNVQTKVFSATLSIPIVHHCPVCGSINENNSIVKWGFKSSLITIPSVCRFATKLNLKKQRYLCRSCGKTFTAPTPIVKKNCFISNDTRTSIILDLKDKNSEKDIAAKNCVSHMTVNRTIASLRDSFIVPKNWLPKHLCFDEFRSVKDKENSMSFICVNSENGNVVNTFQGIRQDKIIHYFMSYKKRARNAVKTVCMDMHFPYYKVVRQCFPNAVIITDRFHIVKLISKALNQSRIDYAKKDEDNAKKLKHYWKLIIKDSNELDDSQFRYFKCFRKMMRETDVVDHLVSLDESLKNTYELYQDLLHALKKKDPDNFYSTIERAPELIHDQMKTSLKTLLKNRDGVTNSMKYSYSNGVIEGTNNLIKVIKRIAFGYRSFVHFRVRILLITNTMVKLNT